MDPKFNEMCADKAIEEATRNLLEQRLAKVTSEQRAFFESIFPGGVPANKLQSAIALCDRTIEQNLCKS